MTIDVRIHPGPTLAEVHEVLAGGLATECAADLAAVTADAECWPGLVADVAETSALRWRLTVNGVPMAVFGVATPAHARPHTWMLYRPGTLSTPGFTGAVRAALQAAAAALPKGTGLRCYSLLALPKSRAWLQRLGFVDTGIYARTASDALLHIFELRTDYVF